MRNAGLFIWKVVLGMYFFQCEFMDICAVKIWKVTTAFVKITQNIARASKRPKGLVAHYACSILIFIHSSRRYKEVSCECLCMCVSPLEHPLLCRLQLQCSFTKWLTQNDEIVNCSTAGPNWEHFIMLTSTDNFYSNNILVISQKSFPQRTVLKLQHINHHV